MRWRPGLLAAAAVPLLALAACGGGGHPTAATAHTPAPHHHRAASPSRPTPTPTPTTSVAVSGTVTGSSGPAHSTGPCGLGQGGLAATFDVSLDGQPYQLVIELLDYHGPGSYQMPPDRASLRQSSSGATAFYASQSGTLTVASGGRSGTISGDLVGNAGTIQLHGTWSCSG
ncbi:MAG TPA: hypothetical protein VIA06_04460 [Candidatus Dormibacteraeota bacterium]|jgi:hypothetical protein|nr:hypothetical protein [Candidatus Dormibacteraeota bacterium]